MWTYPHKTGFNHVYLLNKYLTENFIFCVVNLIASLSYTLTTVNQFLACSKGLQLSAQELLHDNQYTFRT